MPRTVAFLLVGALLAALTGCMQHQTPVRPPEGGLYTGYRAPLTTNFNNTKLGTKVGVARTVYISIPFLWIDFALDSCDIRTAARNGGIKTVTYADYEVQKVLGLFGEFTVRVHGD